MYSRAVGYIGTRIHVSFDDVPNNMANERYSQPIHILVERVPVFKNAGVQRTAENIGRRKSYNEQRNLINLMTTSPLSSSFCLQVLDIASLG